MTRLTHASSTFVDSQLYEHQRAAARTLAERRRVLLGDAPGLGKTRTLLAASYHLGGPALVLCPAIARAHWRHEASVLRHDKVRILSYDTAIRTPPTLAPGETLILDESHYLKHPTSQRTKLVCAKGGLARQAGAVFPASGTPVPRHPGEFAALLLAVWPDVAAEAGLRTLEDVRQRYLVRRGRLVRGQWVEKVISTQHDAEFAALLHQVMLRRTADQIGMDVPSLWFQPWMIEPGWHGTVPAFDPTGKVEALLRALDAGEPVDALVHDPEIARYRRRVGEMKAPLVAETLVEEQQAGGEKVVVFAYHRSVLATLRDRALAAGIGVAYIDGDTPEAARTEAVRAFQQDPATRLFIGQNNACRESLTLTAASRAVLVEPDWTAVLNVQMGSRVARIGQTASRCVAQLVGLAGTIDEAVMRQHSRELSRVAQWY